MEDSNRSTRKTMTAIKNIFLNLIEKKPYYKISVSNCLVLYIVKVYLKAGATPMADQPLKVK